MTLTDLGRTFKIAPAFRFMGVAGGGDDPRDLVGKVKDEKADNKQHYAMLANGDHIYLISERIVTAFAKDLGKPGE